MKNKIIIIEDQIILNEMLKNTISKTFDVVATSTSANDMLELCDKFNPDIVLTDIITKDNANGIINGAKVKDKYHDKIKVIAITGMPDITFLDKIKSANLDGLLYKNIDSETLLKSLNDILNNNKIYLETNNKDIKKLKNLTKKELKILTLLCQGLDREDIAIELNITNGTLKNHISSILEKTEFDSVSKLLIYCISNGYITKSE